MKLDLYYARRFTQWFLVIAGVLMTLVVLIDLNEQIRRFDTLDLGAGKLIGLTLLNAGDNLDAALQRADEALYRAKRAGRNRCEAAWDVCNA